jgi:hypothetical protein
LAAHSTASSRERTSTTQSPPIAGTIRACALAGDSGDRLELDLLGYEFGSATDACDANWLHVRVEAEVAGRRWEATDPCLRTDEVSRLANWLASLAAGVEVTPIDFLEPNVSFEVAGRSGEEVHVLAWFELEFRPAWAASDTAGERDFAAELLVASDHLARAAADLREQLLRFPPRPAPR